MAKILGCSAHDDDVALGAGGIFARHVQAGDEVSVLIFTTGENSHKICLGITANPTPLQLAAVRRREAKKAYSLLGVPNSHLIHWRDYPEAVGVLEQKRDEIVQRLADLVKDFSPDRIYFHGRDGHPDHCFVNDAVLKVSADHGQDHCQGYEFSIWTQELAKGRNDTDLSLIPPLSARAQRIDITPWLPLKRRALHAFRSQVNVWPYYEWNPQAKPVLEAEFLQHFLRGEEIITPVG